MRVFLGFTALDGAHTLHEKVQLPCLYPLKDVIAGFEILGITSFQFDDPPKPE